MKRRSPSKSREVLLRSGDLRGPAIVERCLVADTPGRRLVGLLGRRDLTAGSGIMLTRTGSIHMFFMRFPIDAVFLDGEKRVIKLVPNLRPWRLAAARGAKTVIELAAGESETRALAVGDTIVVDDSSLRVELEAALTDA